MAYKSPAEILKQEYAKLAETDNAVSVVDLADRMREQGQVTAQALNVPETKRLVDIINTDYPDLVFPVKDLICEGLTLFAGASKLGKSRIVLHMCLAVAAGHPFWDRETIQGDVLYLALEDGERRIKQRSLDFSKETGIPISDRLDLRSGQTGQLTVKGGLMDMMQRWVSSKEKPVLIVIDTLQKVRDLAGGNTSAYERDVAFLSGFQEFAIKNHIAIVMVHHLNKRLDSGDPYDRISGSTGIMGTADSILMLSSKRDKTQGAIQYTGRDIQGADIPLVYTRGLWQILSKDDLRRKQREEYESTDIVKVIKEIMLTYPNGIKMSYDDIQKVSVKCIGVMIGIGNTQLAKAIREQADNLLAYDGIRVITGVSIGGNARGVEILPKRGTVTQTTLDESM